MLPTSIPAHPCSPVFFPFGSFCTPCPVSMELVSTCTALPCKAPANVVLDWRFGRKLQPMGCGGAQTGWKFGRKCRRKAKNAFLTPFYGSGFPNNVWLGSVSSEKPQIPGYGHFKPTKIEAAKREVMYKFEKMHIDQGSKDRIIYNNEKMEVIDGRMIQTHEKMEVIDGRMMQTHEKMKVIKGAKAEMVYDNETGALGYDIYSYENSNIKSRNLDSSLGEQEKVEEQEQQEERSLGEADSYREDVKGKINLRSISRFKHWWKSIHEVYRQETALWGFGSSPIFTVYEGKGGKIEKVIINENEIRRRQGIEPFLPVSIDNSTKAHCEDMIRLAHAIAKEIEIGHRKPTVNSTVFDVVKTMDNDTSKSSYQQNIDRLQYVLHISAPSVKAFFLVAMPIYGLYIIWNAYLARRNIDSRDDIKEETSEMRLEKMRKLKARINSIHGNAALGHVPVEQSNFMKKILEVREMARQVRSDEMLVQTPSEKLADVMEYDLEDDIVNGNNNVIEVDMKKGGVEIEAKTDTNYGLEDQDVSGSHVVEAENDMKKGGVEVEAKADLDNGLEDQDVNGHHVAEAYNCLEKGLSDEGIDHVVLIEEKDLNSSLVGISGNSRDINSETTIADHSQTNGWAQNNTTTTTTTTTTNNNNNNNSNNNNNNNDFNSKHFIQKPKPRIIMSLQEAETVLASKKSRLSSINKTDEKPANRMQHQVADESMIASTSYTTSKKNRSCIGDNSESMAVKYGEDLEDQVGVRQKKSDIFNNETCYQETEGKEQQSDRLQFEPSPVHKEDLDGRNDTKKGAHLHTLNIQKNRGKRNDTVATSSKGLRQDSQLSGTGKILTNKGFLSRKTRDIVGGGRPLREEGSFSNTKRWSKELQRRYASEQDPGVRQLIKEMGSELQSWVTEEEIEEAGRLALKLQQGDDDDDNNGIGKRYQEVQRKIENEKKIFGVEAVVEKYREYQAKPEDELWWLDLRYVLCLVVSSKEDGGFYGVDVEIEELKSEAPSRRVKHVVAFEDRKDALKFGRLLEHNSDSGYQHVDAYPFSPKQLFRMAKEEGFKITVLRAGQIDVSIESSLEEAEDQIVAIAKNVYWEREERKHSIDIDSILHQRFGL